MIINGLIIAGSLAITYFIISQWGGRKSKKKKAKAKEKEPAAETDDALDEPSLISQIGHKVINQASIILLDIVKEKLLEYLDSRKKGDENS
jgi:hypothetical protein